MRLASTLLAGLLAASPAGADCLLAPVGEARCGPSHIVTYAAPERSRAGEGEILLVAEVLAVDGSSAANGTRVQFEIRHEQGVTLLDAETQDGLASAGLEAPRFAGNLRIMARAGLVAAEERIVRVEPGPIVAFPLRIEDCNAHATCDVVAGPFRDAYRNRAVTGQSALITVSGPRGVVSQMQAQVVEANLIARMTLPDRTQAWTISVTIDGRTERRTIPARGGGQS